MHNNMELQEKIQTKGSLETILTTSVENANKLKIQIKYKEKEINQFLAHIIEARTRLSELDIEILELEKTRRKEISVHSLESIQYQMNMEGRIRSSKNINDEINNLIRMLMKLMNIGFTKTPTTELAG